MTKKPLSVLVLFMLLLFFGCDHTEITTEIDFKDPVVEILEDSTVAITVQSNEMLSSKDTIYLIISSGTAIYDIDFTTNVPIKNDTLKIHGSGQTNVTYYLNASCDTEFEDLEFVEFEVVKFSRGVRLGLAKKIVVNISDEDSNNSSLFFDGIDDLIDLGDIFDDLELPLTVEAWIKVDPAVGYTFPVFVSQDNDPLYNGFQFLIQPTSIAVEFGDGRGENNSAYRRGKQSTIDNISNKWVHVAAVMVSGTNMTLYVNGLDVAGNYSGNSPNTMASAFPNDNAKIGYWLSNGLSSRFKGYMDEVRVWNRALSQSDIAAGMCGELSGNENGLIGYWGFNEETGATIYDHSPNSFDGILIGNPLRTKRAP